MGVTLQSDSPGFASYFVSHWGRDLEQSLAASVPSAAEEGGVEPASQGAVEASRHVQETLLLCGR